MGRNLSAGLEALIATGNYTRHSTMDVVLTSGAELHLSTIEITVEVDGEPREYQAMMGDVGTLDMGLTLDMDELEFAVFDASLEIGRSLTGAIRQLDGALAMKGQLFINNDDPEEVYYDPQVPGELVAGDVSDGKVMFSFISEIDAVIVSGRLISEEFPTVAASSPNPERPGDLPLPNRPGGLGGNPGRYEPIDPLEPPITGPRVPVKILPET